MERAHLLRSEDIRFLMDLVGELHEISDEDRAARRQHLAKRVCEQFNAYLTVLVEATGYRPLGFEGISRVTESGYRDERERQFFDAYIESTHAADPVLDRSFQIVDPNLTARREELVSDKVWLNSPLYNEFYRLTKVEQLLHTRAAVGHSELGIGLGIHRHGSTRYTDRETQLAEVLNNYLPRLHPLMCAKLADEQDKLPARYERVVERLKHGDTIKQTAYALGLSPHTVQSYVKEIYRHYGVSSRSQLLVHLLGSNHPPTPPGRQYPNV